MTERESERVRERERDAEPQPPFGPSVGSLCHPLALPTVPVGGSLGAPESGPLRAPESGSLGTPKSDTHRDIRDT